MTCSHRRLVALAALWLVFGVVAFAASGGFAAVAQDDRGCSSPPCAFPAESNMGGILLGTDDLSGDDLVSFGYDGNSYVYPTAPDRAEDTTEVVGLGINQITTGQFYVFKSWYYDDSRSSQRVPVNVWIDAESADLSGSSQCGNGNSGFGGSANCDLLAYPTELAAREMQVTTSCSSTVWIGCAVVPGSFNPSEYHSVNIEQDTCSAFDGLGGDVCLSLISDGGTCVAGVCVEADSVDAQDISIRAPYYRAQKGSDNTDKVMTLNDAYLEIGYGHGFDRVNVMTSTHGSDWQQNVDAPYGESAVGVSFLCQGGGPDTNCNLKSGRGVDSTSPWRKYDNVHQSPTQP